jgi:5'-3' exonuclease
MGIPGYFVDLLRRNRQVLLLARDAGTVDVVCIDANSVIYEAVRIVEGNEVKEFEANKIWPVRLGNMSQEDAARRLVPVVVATLVRLPGLVGATKQLVVAFDGVAPAAKLAQQRQRRFGRLMLGSAMAQIQKQEGGCVGDIWLPFDTTQITPATPFMRSIMPMIERQLRGITPISLRFSGSGLPGEGEHKLMDIIRSGEWADQHVIVHGLDADLILLTLVNSHHCKSLRLAREAPSFVRQIDPTLSPSDTYVIDIARLSESIAGDMGADTDAATSDYVFLMSMLGNDFLPHQPAISIRDGGIERLCAAYSVVRAEDPEFRVMHPGPPGTKTHVPDWSQLQVLLGELAGQEDQVMTKLAKRRRGYASRTAQPGKVPFNPEELEAIWNKLPGMQNGAENWIDAGSPGWRGRYYEHGTGEIVDDPEMPWSPWLEKATEDWLAGLQWVWEYYTGPNPSWTWQYQGTHPPPLLLEVTRMGSFDNGLDKLVAWRDDSVPVSDEEQTARVLPPRNEDGTWALDGLRGDMKWEYCRHAWEAEMLV